MQTSPSHRSLKEKQREEREALILQIAEEVLLERGYHETSMDEIASRVGIAKGTVYLHFPSKDDLIVAIFTRDMQEFLSHIDEVVDAQPSPKEKLEALYHLMYAGLFNKRTRLFSTLYYSVDMRHLFVEKGKCMHDLWEIVTNRVEQLLDEGKATGDFNSDLPTSIIACAFISLLSPKSYERLIIEMGVPLEEVIACAEKIFFRGIAANGK
jgi:TetR/AcrR family transcriptional regulator, fatty acid metabolism regulator protein